ncbi:tRNA (guanine-N1)-methyltransferase [Mariniflexile sp.]|uniref:tRNA (guanine-N1)-methyltransferase n=1 Tax=Mariniflexile sp. TaxID=1979402 RepID=UPI004048AB69
MNYFKLPTLLIFLISFANSAQDADNDKDKLSLNSGPLENQFEYAIQKSNGWRDERGQEYRVIKTFWLTELKAHVLDSIQTIKKEVTESQITLKAQAQEISDLKTSVSNIQSTLDKTKSEKDNMSLLGIQMGKSGYSAVMWSIVGVLFALLLFFIYSFKNSNTVTKDAKRSLTELEDEFEEHRKTAVEREQKVRRQLQDEINKQKIIRTKK